ncbi:MAG TPA: non-homologous end-joining DNA ligase [Kofleriaceae bacterium]|nr:non-homologous end-joining DNA ligase [Kofleriaceae bacterium]
MADTRGRRRRRRTSGENAFTFARQLTLTPIAPGDARTAAGDLIEPAWDGHRVLATRVGDDVRIAALDFRDWTQTFPAAARALGKLAASKVAIDGVVCVLDPRGAPSFEQLRVAVAKGAAVTDAVVICWDLLWHDDEDLRTKPLEQRRKRLELLLHDAPKSLMPSQALEGTLARVLEAAAPLGLRGVVARAHGGEYTAPWCAYSTSATAIDWRRSLSPPPPLSNADKVLYPRDGICKRDIVGYYRDVAPLLLPHLIDRPVVVQRWPDGIDEFDWYQHRVPPRAPDYLRAAWVDGVRRIVIENEDALLWMVNQAGLTYHGFASRLSSIAEPDYAVIDLDPGDKTTWPDVVEIALAVRRVLELLELPNVLKTSGQRGLHILIPLAPGQTFAQAEELGRGVASLMLRLLPDKCTVENEKEKRGGRLLVDHKQFMAKTLVVPYSLRAVDRATASTPLAWDDLTPALDVRSFTLRTLRARLDKHGDLAAPLLRAGSQLAPALAQLRRQ